MYFLGIIGLALLSVMGYMSVQQNGAVSQLGSLLASNISGSILQTAAFTLAAEGGSAITASTNISNPPGFRLALAGEPVPPAGGGYIPSGSGAPKTDSVGYLIGYCVWNHGTAPTITGPNATFYLLGLNTASTAANVVNTAASFALILPGDDGIFQTDCTTAASGAALGDDTVVRHTVAELARTAANFKFNGTGIQYDGDTTINGALTANSLSLTTPLPIASGGTNANTADAALTNLGGGVEGKLLFATTTTATARSTLGLGTMATQDATAVAIVGGTIDGAVIGGVTPAAISGTTMTATGAVTGQTIVSTAATGTSPLTIASTTMVPNLTASALGAVGQDAAFFRNASNLNAGTIPAAQMPAFTGDVTSAIGTTALSLGTTGVAAGSYGDGLNVPQVTVNTQGRVTSVVTVPIGTVANASTAGIAGAMAASGLSGQVALANGGTGSDLHAASDGLIVKSGAGSLTRSLAVTANTGLGVNNPTGVGANPTFYGIAMTGATAGVAGNIGMVPAPTAGQQDNVLTGDGTFRSVANALGYTPVNKAGDTMTGAFGIIGNTTAASPSLSIAGSNTTGLFSPGAASKILAFSTNGVERLRLDATGNVFAGTTAPNPAGNDGFFNLASNSGVPSSVAVTTQAGYTPLYLDSDTHKLYAYTGSWNEIAGSGGGGGGAWTGGDIGSAAWALDGSAATPGYAFTNSHSTGIYRSGGNLGFSIAGANHLWVTTTGISSDALNATPIGNTTAASGAFTTLSATGAVSLNGAGAAISLQPTGAGTVTIAPTTIGSINNMTIGATTPASGTFTTLSATASTTLQAASATDLSSTTITTSGLATFNGHSTFGGQTDISPNNATVTISPPGTGTVVIAPATSGTIDKMRIGATTPASGAFTTLSASSGATLQAVTGTTFTASTGFYGPLVSSSGASTLSLGTNSGTSQVSILHTPSATRTLTLTGATAGNAPTIGTTGGDLALSSTSGLVTAPAITLGSSPLAGATLNEVVTASWVLAKNYIAGDGTETIIVDDNKFTLRDDLVHSKTAQFQLSGITSGNMRTMTLPDYDATLATLAGTETLTNKTIQAANGNLAAVSYGFGAAVNTGLNYNGTILQLVVGGSSVATIGSTSTFNKLGASSTAADAIASGGGIKIADTADACTVPLNGALRWNSSTVQVCSGTTWTALSTTVAGITASSADILTNKTIDTAGPNIIKINGNTLAASAGSATITLPTSGTLLTTLTGLSNSLTSANIFVGNGSNVATGVAVSGDASLTSGGLLTVNSIGGKAISLANSLATSGNFATTLTATAATNVTLPTSGTLATLAGTESLTNKTISAVTLTTTSATGSSITSGGGVKIGSTADACIAGLNGAMRWNAGTMELCSGTTWTGILVNGSALSGMSSASLLVVGNGAAGAASGSGTVALGPSAMSAVTTGIGNTAVGYQAGYYVKTGTDNTYVGNQAGFGALTPTGASNTGIGSQALKTITNAIGTTAIGYQAGATGANNLTTESQVTLLGAGTALGVTGQTNATAIGYGAATCGSNCVQLGNSSVIQIITAGSYIAGVGAVGSPSYAFAGETNTGVYRPGAGQIGFAVLGAGVGSVTATGLNGVAIGSTTPAAGSFTSLAASGGVTFNGAGAAISLQPTGAGTVTIKPATAGTIDAMAIGQTTPAAATFTSAVYTSDRRLKRDIAPITDGVDRLKSLSPMTFRWNGLAATRGLNDNDRHLGVIAQDVEAVLPEAVRTGADGYKAVDYAALVVPLIAAVKEQQAEITELRTEVRRLKRSVRAGGAR